VVRWVVARVKFCAQFDLRLVRDSTGLKIRGRCARIQPIDIYRQRIISNCGYGVGRKTGERPGDPPLPTLDKPMNLTAPIRKSQLMVTRLA
jgi:hypothetical protein